MDQAIYFQLLNPITMAIFALGFWFINRQAEGSRAALVFAAAYTVLCLGFTVDALYLRGPAMEALHLSSRVLMLSGAVLLVVAVHLFRRTAVPISELTGLAALSVAVLGYLTFVQPAPVLKMAFSSGVGAVLMLLCARAFLTRSRLDLLLAGLFSLSAFTLVARPLFVIMTWGLGNAAAIAPHSTYEVAFHFTTHLSSLTVGGALLFALGVDIMKDLTHASQRDPLSGCLNRRGVEAALELGSFARRRGERRMVIAIDIDHFKSINDRFGHAAGDEVIQAFGRTVQAVARSHDIVARTGGEEFMVIISVTSPRIGERFAERARLAVSALKVPAIEGSSLTASFGVAEWTDAASYAEVTAKADEALYEAKATGRNRVVIAPSTDTDNIVDRAAEELTSYRHLRASIAPCGMVKPAAPTPSASTPSQTMPAMPEPDAATA